MRFRKLVTTLAGGVMFALASQAATAAEWRLGNILPPEHLGNKSLEAAAATIKERTEGRVDIKVFPAGQIGSAKEILTGMTVGTHQMAFDGAGIMSQWTSELGAFEAPFLAKDFDHLKRLYASPKGQELTGKLLKDHGLRVLDIWYYGTRHMTNNAHPINSVADVSGLKMRVPEVKLSLEFMKALGGRPTPMAFPELYLGLQTGVVDGQENPLPTINSGKFFEVQKHLALTGHLVQMVAPIVAEDVWQATSEADRAVVVEVLQAEGAKYNAAIAKLEADLVAELEGKGMQVTRPDRAEFAKAVEPIFAGFAEAWGADTYKALSEVE